MPEKKNASAFISKPRVYKMRVECAWCGKYMRTVKATNPGQVSHGICGPCKEEALKEVRK